MIKQILFIIFIIFLAIISLMIGGMLWDDVK